MNTPRTIAVLLTCHNRVDKTLKCLSHLSGQSLAEGLNVSIYLVDDGSTDETGKKVQDRYPDVNVIYGDGCLFWNGGMHRAFAEALKVGFDYYLWLNDDTYLYGDSLQSMLTTHAVLGQRGRIASIVIASTRDSRTGEFTYGGYRRKSGFCNSLRMRLIEPEDVMISCDTMCGNCVLIPKEVSSVVGNIDPRFKHRWGDADYGLRARAANCEIWIAPGYLADCDGNPNTDKWRNRKFSLKLGIEEIHSIKGFGKEDWLRYTHIHGGKCWPLIWARPYLRVAYGAFRSFIGSIFSRQKE